MKVKKEPSTARNLWRSMIENFMQLPAEKARPNVGQKKLDKTIRKIYK